MTEQNQKELVKRIRSYYIEDTKEINKLEELKELDKRVKTPAIIFAYVFGIIGTLVLGLGMCLAMKVIGDIMILGIIIGIVGILIVSVNYNLYMMILNKRKAKFADSIISKSNELLNETETNIEK